MAIASPVRHDLMPQLLRFAFVGLGVTALSAFLYLRLVGAGLPPLAATVLGHVAGVVTGFRLHSRWSFGRHDAGVDAARFLRFVAGSGGALALNALWVWGLVSVARGPAWAPVPAMLVATPVASFALNRWWVFAAR